MTTAAENNAGAEKKPGPASTAGMVDLVAENLQLKKQINDERKGHTRTYISVIAALSVVVLFLGYLAFVHFPQNQFIATDNTAAACRIWPTDRPYIPEANVKDFAESAVVSIYTYGYSNYRKAAQDTADKYFSNNFADPFIAMFSNSAGLQEVIQKRFDVTSVSNPNQPPIVSRSGLRKGSWAWVVDVPVLVYYVSGRDQHSERILASVTVIEVPPTRRNPSGLAIDDIVLRQSLS